MVNTFLVDTNFLVSARLLDRKRLPNQRREALQILHNIQKLKSMGLFIGDPLPNDPYMWYPWIRRVIQSYRVISKQLNGSLMCFQDQWVFTSGESLEVPTLTITYGFIYHPAVLMWLGYEDALKEYLDAHIEATIERGFKNTMIRYPCRNAPRPAWTWDNDFIARHRAVLLHKELTRVEDPWYQLMSTFTSTSTEGVPCLYYWPYTPSIGKSANNQGEADLTQRYLVRKKICVKLKSTN